MRHSPPPPKSVPTVEDKVAGKKTLVSVAFALVVQIFHTHTHTLKHTHAHINTECALNHMYAPTSPRTHTHTSARSQGDRQKACPQMKTSSQERSHWWFCLSARSADIHTHARERERERERESVCVCVCSESHACTYPPMHAHTREERQI